tara:strand:- start:1637 stop:1831 length:195 start_codon:yes stop_codon:yes gene_type:complete
MVMPHFAKLDDNNIVEKVNVYSQEDVDANGGDYSAQAEAWVETREVVHGNKLHIIVTQKNNMLV